MNSLPKPLYTTYYGAAYLGDALDLLKCLPDESMDLVLTFFAGSNTTGATAESLGRKWIAFELNQTYLAASTFRFLNKIDENTVRIL